MNSDKRNDRIERLYVSAGKSLREIAAKVELSRTQVQNILISRGVKRRPPGGRRAS